MTSRQLDSPFLLVTRLHVFHFLIEFCCCFRMVGVILNAFWGSHFLPNWRSARITMKTLTQHWKLHLYLLLQSWERQPWVMKSCWCPEQRLRGCCRGERQAGCPPGAVELHNVGAELPAADWGSLVPGPPWEQSPPWECLGSEGTLEEYGFNCWFSWKAEG